MMNRFCGIAMVTAMVVTMTGCATIKFGGEMTKRYDKDGNEVAFITHVNASRVSGAAIEKEAMISGAAVGAATGAGIPSLGVGRGMVGGALIAGAIKAIKDSGKLEVRITDFDRGTETAPKNAWDDTLRAPWDGWGALRPLTWAKIQRDSDGFILTACNPACPPVPDASGKINPLPPEKHMWMYIRGPRTFLVEKSISLERAEIFAKNLPPDIGEEVLRKVRERIAATETPSASQ